MSKEKTRKIFLEELPRWEAGRYKGKINWLKSIGYKVKFIYDDIEGWVEIVAYKAKGQYLYIKYLDSDIFKIKTTNFTALRLRGLLNNIVVSNPWMVKFFQGGYDEAKLYTRSSKQKIKPICPDCGRIRDKEISIYDIYANKSISCTNCGDGIHYPEKFMFNVLQQLNIEFKTQLTKTTFDWCKDYRYDFYIPSLNCIIETHGRQHYEKTGRKGARTIDEEQQNDRLKKELALSNGIKEEDYIVIDCRESELKWIKDNILKSRLFELFDLSNINWLKCEEFALNNRVKEACEHKKNNPDMTTKDIGVIMRLDCNTIRRYLIKGSKLKWCSYDPKDEIFKSSSKNGKASCKQVEIFKDGISLGVFKSIIELSIQSECLFGIKLSTSKISLVCKGKRSHHKGFTFSFYRDN